MFCTNCGTQNDEGAKFCVNCGTGLEEIPEQVPVEEIGVQEVNDEVGITEFTDPVSNQKKSFLDMLKNPKNIIIAVAVLVVVVLIVAGISLFGSDEVDFDKYPLVYTSDGKVKVLPYGEDESYKLGNNIDFADVSFSEGADYIYFVENGKLYCREADDLEARDDRLASDVASYTILGDTENVVYKTNDGDLYFHDLDEKYKIAKDVESYSFDENYKNVKYLTDNGKLYIRGLGENDEPIKIDSKVDYTVYTDPSFKNIYYVKDEAIYLYNGKDSKKIGKDFCNADYIGKTLYAFREVKGKYGFDDVVNDDLSDSLGIEPYLHLKRPRSEDYSSYSEYEDAYDYWYDELYDEYYDLDEDILDAFDTYEEIQDAKRDFDENPIEITTYDLYVYEDGEFKKIDSGLTSDYLDEFYTEDEENDFACYKNNGSGIGKIKLSDYEDSIYSLRYEIPYASSGDSSDGEYVLLKNGKIMEGLKNADEIYDLDVSFDGKYLYAFIKDEEDESGDVARYKIGSNKVTDSEVILEDVEYFSDYGNGVVFAWNDDDELIALIDGEELNLGEDIYTYRYVDGEIYYIADYDEESNSGELIRYNDGDKITICDDVYSDFAVFSENKIVYIQDYDGSEGGELCISDKRGNAEVVDDEVTAFMTYYY